VSEENARDCGVGDDGAVVGAGAGVERLRRSGVGSSDRSDDGTLRLCESPVSGRGGKSAGAEDDDEDDDDEDEEAGLLAAAEPRIALEGVTRADEVRIGGREAVGEEAGNAGVARWVGVVSRVRCARASYAPWAHLLTDYCGSSCK